MTLWKISLAFPYVNNLLRRRVKLSSRSLWSAATAGQYWFLRVYSVGWSADTYMVTSKTEISSTNLMNMIKFQGPPYPHSCGKGSAPIYWSPNIRLVRHFWIRDKVAVLFLKYWMWLNAATFSQRIIDKRMEIHPSVIWNLPMGLFGSMRWVPQVCHLLLLFVPLVYIYGPYCLEKLTIGSGLTEREYCVITNCLLVDSGRKQLI